MILPVLFPLSFFAIHFLTLQRIAQQYVCSVAGKRNTRLKWFGIQTIGNPTYFYCIRIQVSDTLYIRTLYKYPVLFSIPDMSIRLNLLFSYGPIETFLFLYLSIT